MGFYDFILENEQKSERSDQYMIYADGLNFGDKREEMLEMDKMGFPYACYYRELDGRFCKMVPWHWHKSIEIDYIMEGELIFTTSDQTITLKQGDICFINSGVLHSFHINVKSHGCKFYAHLFHPSFIGGMHNSQIEQKYVLPITGNSAVTYLHFPEGTSQNKEMVPVFLNIAELDRKQPLGYEFAIRDGLSKLWCVFFTELCSIRENFVQKESAGSRRVKEMIQYIHENYQGEISLGDIAKVSQISRQECMRCFQKYIHTSPIAYLTEFRIRIAAEQLRYTDESVIRISENCGFSSSSYFSKVFRSIMGCTPSEYRKI